MLRKLGTSLSILGRFSSKKRDLEGAQCPSVTSNLRDFEYSELIQNYLKVSRPVSAYSVLVQVQLA